MRPENLAELVYRHTLEWGAKNGFKTEELTPDQEKWVNFFKTHNHMCDKKTFINFVETLTGTDLSILDRKSCQLHYTFGVVVIPVACYNNHSYEMGKPIICANPASKVFFTLTGHEGNHMDTEAAASLPTLENVTRIVKAVAKKNKSFYSKLVSLMESKYGNETTV